MLDLVTRLKFNPSECDDCCDLTSSSFKPSCVCCFLLQVASSNEQIAQQDTGKPYYLSNFCLLRDEHLSTVKVPSW